MPEITWAKAFLIYYWGKAWGMHGEMQGKYYRYCSRSIRYSTDLNSENNKFDMETFATATRCIHGELSVVLTAVAMGIYCTSHYVYTKIQAEFLSNQDERAPLVASRAIRVRLGHFASYCYSCTARVSTRVLWPARPRSWVQRAAARNGQSLVLLYSAV